MGKRKKGAQKRGGGGGGGPVRDKSSWKGGRKGRGRVGSGIPGERKDLECDVPRCYFWR